MEKNANKAIETIKALRREFASNAIKDYEIPTLVNRKTLEDVVLPYFYALLIIWSKGK